MPFDKKSGEHTSPAVSAMDKLRRVQQVNDHYTIKEPIIKFISQAKNMLKSSGG